MYVIGISAYYHDSSVALFEDGNLIFACEEEKFSGIKHDSGFPHLALKYIYKKYNIQPEEVEMVCYYEDPEIKISRVWNNFFKNFLDVPFTMLWSILSIYKNVRELKKNLKKISNNIYYSTHHDSHIHYSYHTSPFEDAVILSIDGVGEEETLCVGYAKHGKMDIIPLSKYPHSVGLFYAAMTSFLGFKPNEGEYKVMGLASYGDPEKYRKKVNRLLIHSCASLKCNMQFFEWDRSNKVMFNENLSEFLGLPNRLPEDPLTQDYMDLAASVQEKYEKVLFELLRDVQLFSDTKNLCLAGGCAYNGTANGKIKENTKFEKLWIPVAPSDAGSSIGACLAYLHQRCNYINVPSTPFLGPSYSDVDITNEKWFIDTINSNSDIEVQYKLTENQINKMVSKDIVDGLVVGWFKDEIEFGARALGHRSILADPRHPEMRDRINKVVKKREGFRPFAPMVIFDEQGLYFETEDYIPYMNQVVKVKPEHRYKLPSVVHVDGTSRVQSVTTNNIMYPLLLEFKKLSGYPILLNTSFNVKDKTIVLTPKDAMDTFLNTDMDCLMLDNIYIKKKNEKVTTKN